MKELLQSIGLQPTLLVMQILSFLVLAYVLRKFLFGPVGGMIEARNREVAERLANAERDERAMEAVRTEYERRIAEIESESRDRIQSAMAEAHRIADEIKETARTESEAIRQRGLAQVQREREKALKEIQDQVVDLAIDAAEKVVHQTCDDTTQRALVRSFLDGVATGPSAS